MVSESTLSIYLKGTLNVGKPHRAAKSVRGSAGSRSEREAVADEGPADLSHCNSYTMPDDE